MYNILKLKDAYLKSVSIKVDGDYVFAAPPFYHIDSGESIALKFYEAEDGRHVITDCGTTKDYLSAQYINLSDYREKLKAIKERFFIEEDGREFVMITPTDNMHRVCEYVGYFIQAISIIANIDL